MYSTEVEILLADHRARSFFVIYGNEISYQVEGASRTGIMDIKPEAVSYG